jgi:hypothetical protein
VGDFGECCAIFDRAKKVWLLDHNAGRGFVDCGGQLLWREHAGGRADGFHLHAEVFQVRGNREPILGVQARRHDDFAIPAGRADRHQHRLGRGTAAVVEAGVRDIEPGEPRDQRLILEHDLQIALADFGLVGRVRGVELAPAGKLVDHRGHEMIVAAAAQEADLVLGVGVLGRERRHVLRELNLAHRGRNGELALQPQVGRNHCKEFFNRTGANRVEHRELVFGRVV